MVVRFHAVVGWRDMSGPKTPMFPESAWDFRLREAWERFKDAETMESLLSAISTKWATGPLKLFVDSRAGSAKLKPNKG